MRSIARRHDPTNQVVHTEDGTAVDAVMVAGRMVVEDRRPVGVDLERLSAKVEAARERLQATTAPTKVFCEKLSVIVNTFCPGPTSHTRTVPSREPETSRNPSGLNATVCTSAACPFKVRVT